MLDIENFEELDGYLRRAGRIAASEKPSFQILSGGVSNRVVMVQFPGGNGWVLKQALEKLRVQVDWFCSPERIRREAAALSLLETLAPPGSITPLLFEDPDQQLLAMEAAPSPNTNWKTSLLAGDADPRLFEDAGTLLGTVHARGTEVSPGVREAFADQSFFHALRVEPYYLRSAETVPEAAEKLNALVEEMSSVRTTIVHGDFSPKNLLVHNGRLILLDHEVAHLGDPAFDLGFFLAHILSKARHLRERRLLFCEGARLFWASYQRALQQHAAEWNLESRAVRHTLGCLLARVRGRSPLEYLSSEERVRQKDAVLALWGATSTLDDLVQRLPSH